MKKMLGIALAMFTVFALNAQSIQEMSKLKTSQELDKYKKEKIDTISNENLKKGYMLSYVFCKNLLNKDVLKMSFDEFEKIALNNVNEKDIIHMKRRMISYVLYVKPYTKFQKDVYNKYKEDSNYNDIIGLSFPIYADAEIYGNVQNYRKALIKSLKNQKNIIYAKKIVNKYIEIIDEIKEEEVKKDLKQMKKHIYPKINQGDEWKNLAVQIELQLKALE